LAVNAHQSTICRVTLDWTAWARGVFSVMVFWSLQVKITICQIIKTCNELDSVSEKLFAQDSLTLWKKISQQFIL